MGKARRGGYVFLRYKGDHDPPHVHVYRSGRLVVKWNLRDGMPMRGHAGRKLRRLIELLVQEGKL